MIFHRNGIIAAVAVAALAAGWNYYLYNEFFGDGPPYYDLTTNMDKWADPRLFMLLITVLAGAAVTVILYFSRRR